jgi:predicted transcriptional regulator
VREALKKVERAASKRDRAQVELRAAIIEAREQGASLREIARAAGLSHTYIAQIIEAQGKTD